MNKYICIKCNYQTNSQFNFKRHQQSIRHHKNTTISPIEQVISPIEQVISPIEQVTSPIEQVISPIYSDTSNIPKFTCQYCTTEYKRKAYLNRHLSKCSNKIIQGYKDTLDLEKVTQKAINKHHEDKFNELKVKYEEEIVHLKEENNKLQNKYSEHTIKLEGEITKLRSEIMQMTQSVLKIAETQATVPKKQTNNTQYIINNYKDAPNLEFPIVDWSAEMIEKYVKMGAVRGLSKIITDHWVDNIPPEQRSIWTVDLARNKFLIRIKDAWVVDIDGNKFQEITIDKIYKIFINYMKESKRNPIDMVDLMEFICDIRNKNMGMKALKDAGKYLIYDNEKFKDEIPLIDV